VELEKRGDSERIVRDLEAPESESYYDIFVFMTALAGSEHIHREGLPSQQLPHHRSSHQTPKHSVASQMLYSYRYRNQCHRNRDHEQFPGCVQSTLLWRSGIAGPVLMMDFCRFEAESISCCHGRGREFESRRPRHSFQKDCSNFAQAIEDPKGHVFVPFIVSLLAGPPSGKVLSRCSVGR
jgi:hypothetical protein